MAPPPVHQRYNTARVHKKGKARPKTAKEQQEGEGDSEGDAHATTGPVVAAMSTKKRKRLDSYIAKKLLLERRNDTLKTLASMAPSTSTSLSLYSTASLGQNPLKPTSARERQEVTEDRVVRRTIDRLSRRADVGSSSDEEEETRGKRKGKQRAAEVVQEVQKDNQGVQTTVLPTKAERKAAEKEQARGQGKSRMPKKAGWNPNLLRTQPESESDFDSSDSANDSVDESDEEKGEAEGGGDTINIDESEEAEAGPSISPDTATISAPQDEAAQSVAVKLPPPALGGALKATTGGALKTTTGGALKTTTGGALKTTTGGPLKTTADGVPIQPRVVVRGSKRFLGTAPEPDSSDEDEDDDEDADDDEDEEDEDDDEENDEDEDSDEEDSDEDDEEDEDENDEEPEEQPKPKRSLGFKNWALQQMGQPSAPAPSGSTADTPELYPVPAGPSKPSRPAPKTGEFIGPLGATLSIPSTSLLNLPSSSASNSTPAVPSETSGVSGTGASKRRGRPEIKRRDSVAEARMELPILAEEQSIVEAILMHPVVVICGETGSGKTTQVPQMLYEAGFGVPGSDDPGMIAVTQPRRVAAVSLAVRVKSELNLPASSGVVAHQIRYSSTSSPETAIKFMTDGVLLRELASDFLLSRYSVVVVDEAHERGVNTDVLIGVLSRVAKLREKQWREGQESARPLRIVIMSATLRVSDFAENTTLFAIPPPVIHIGARQHPVTVHFARKTSGDYVNEAYKKVCKIHSRLPPGGVLVFMTGQSEIMGLCRKLEKKHVEKKEALLPPESVEAEDIELGRNRDLAGDVDDGIPESDDEALETDDEIDGLPDFIESSPAPMHVLPLYSLLSNDQQMAVFKPPPEGARLVIIATNVAETSLTIPGIRYVVDCGRAKERQFDASSGVQTFAVSWISKASAQQRAGRAGRTGPGHCYRLYSSALFEDHFEAFSAPEILRMPIEGVVLNMKSMNIDAVANFPFPTPPDRLALRKAEALLQHLGALDQPTATTMVNGVQVAGRVGGQITELGRKMAGFPVSPRFAKMLVIGAQHGCLPYIIAIVAGLSVGDPFVHQDTLELGQDEEDGEAEGGEGLEHIRSEDVRAKEERKDLRRRYFKAHGQFMALGKAESDMFKLLAAIGAYEYDPTASFCAKNFLRHKAMQEIQQLRSQISVIANTDRSPITPPTSVQLKVIRQILLAGFIDQIAVLQSLALKRGSPSHASCRGIAYRATGVPEPVYIHPSSSLYHRSPPEFVVFTEVVRTSRAWVKGVTKVNPAWLSEIGKSLCTFSRPVETLGMKAASTASGTGKVGKVGENERTVIVVPHFKDLGVDLPAVKRTQRREGTRWVMLE